MNQNPHRLTQLILGIAYALEKIHLIVPGASPDLKAYLFSFESKKAEQYFMNLMTCTLRMQLKDSWISYCATEYNQHPLAQRVGCWEQVKNCFTIEKNLNPEECFDSSRLKESSRDLAKEVYQKHKEALDQIIAFLYQNKPTLGLEYDFGILFIQKDD